MSSNNVILLLGSNLGNKKNNIELAIKFIEKKIGKIFASTEILITEPVEFVSNNNFCNIALCISTPLSPTLLLRKIKKIEEEMGRSKDSYAEGKYLDRIIDIDIVIFNNIKFKSKFLEIPHSKHVYERDFSKELLGILKEKIKTQI